MTRGLNRDDSCYHCGSTGHFSSECAPSPRLPQKSPSGPTQALNLLLWRLGVPPVDLEAGAFPTAKAAEVIEQHFKAKFGKVVAELIDEEDRRCLSVAESTEEGTLYLLLKKLDLICHGPLTLDNVASLLVAWRQKSRPAVRSIPTPELIASLYASNRSVGAWHSVVELYRLMLDTHDMPKADREDAVKRLRAQLLLTHIRES